MATEEDDDGGLTFYPAFCHKASPTHFAWVKMSAADVHRLKTRRGFEGQNLYFYHNHPIQFVCLAGVIVARTEYPRRTVLTLDDSSGETIEIVVLKSTPPDAAGNDISAPAAAAAEETSSAPPPPAGAPGPDPNPEALKPQHLTSTTHSPLSITPLTPGTVLKAKGTLSTFRSSIQLNLERFAILPDTNAEMRFWDERARFLVEVLSVPWCLGEEEVLRLRREAEEEGEKVAREKRKGEERRRRKAEREERDRRRIWRRWEREEMVREREAAVCREAGRRVQEVQVQMRMRRRDTKRERERRQ
ncbi:hypothetical protein VTN00DRAFT_6837 [Thermoascus crustaceus]|uniref:uncharacterized protein n=1 Tax=Thermoascus crustaceus TaxID=5088 RepID=UPI0037436579